MNIADAIWRKSSYSGTEGNCVEVALTPAMVGVRDTKASDQGVLVVPAAAWSAFTGRVQPTPSALSPDGS